MNQRIEQIVAGEVQVDMAYIPTGIETQTGRYVQEKTEELMSDSHKALSAALDKLYEMTPTDWDIVFALAGKVQSNLFRLWKSATSSVNLDPETMLPRIYFMVTEDGHRSRYVHLFTPEEWQLAKNSTYDSDRLIEQVVESIREQVVDNLTALIDGGKFYDCNQEEID
jgi:hypothetical protein